jgi:Ca2+-binding RTX toxin-like protein
MAKAKPVILNVLGTNGNDILRSTNGLQSFDGGAGIDTLVFDEGTQGVTVNLKTGKMIDSFGQAETLSGIEIIIGTSFNDKITGSDFADYLIGGGGNDTLSGGLGSDELYGGDGDDILIGGGDSDYFVGGRGNDTIKGGSGFDLVDYSDEGGTLGITVNLATKKIIDTYGDTDAVTGVDRVRGTDVADSMTGNGSANLFEGGAGNDTLDGAGGDDILWAGFGDDTLIGGTGNDQLVGGRGDDKIDGGKGVDVVDYSLDGGWHGASVNLQTGVAEDTWGSYDTIKNVENVVGSQFNDWFLGNASANAFTGGAGNDVMTGGAGADTFIFGANHGNDRINDFSAGDVLDLRGLGFTSVADIVAASVGHELGVQINTGDGSSILLVDVNISNVATLGYLFA